jgi:hypothetical protein
VTVDEKTGCWNWGSGRSRAYGYFKYGDRIDHPAHIQVYDLYVGPVPTGLILRHKCDNTKCVNPDHLTPGTKKDNRHDFMERHPRADEILAEGVLRAQAGCKKWWNNMTKEERQEFCDQRSKVQAEKGKRVASPETKRKITESWVMRKEKGLYGPRATRQGVLSG